jgi:hypothetical protein
LGGSNIIEHDLIITAASQSYATSLLALVGSINVNWPGHPRILVYDLGLDPEPLAKLNAAGIEVRKVPPFCLHWRQHFAWKLWCMHDAPCENLLWLDAAVCLLRPLDEAFIAIHSLGYFAPTNGWTLSTGVCEPLRLVFGFERSTLNEMLSITGCVFGTSKTGKGRQLIEEAMQLALKEENLQAAHPLHRHDQALLSLLLHKHYAPVVFADHAVYAGWTSPKQFAVQKVWVHRRSMREEDQKHFISQIVKPGATYFPQTPVEPCRSLIHRLYYSILDKISQCSKPALKVYDGIRE